MPSDFDFPGAMDKVRLRIRVGLDEDSTLHLCHWQIPQSHPLEAWSDTRAYDGTVSIVQPLIAPLYVSKSDHEILSVLANDPERGGHEIVRSYWNDQHPNDFQSWWQSTLEKGLVAGLALPTAPWSSATVKDANMLASLRAAATQTATVLVRQHSRWDASGPSISLCFRPDPCIWDGRVRQQRLAPGTSQAPHQTHLGQRRLPLANSGRKPRPTGTTT